MIQSCARKQRLMSTPHERPSELSVLMDLRLAFGPGTRLWALRSREELCYDWLHFKRRQPHADFRAFALTLYGYEKAHSAPVACLRAIRRRIASVLRSYQIGRRPHAATPPRQVVDSFVPSMDYARQVTPSPPGNDVRLTATEINRATLPDGTDIPISQPKAAC